MDPTEFLSVEDTPEFAEYEQYEAEKAELAMLPMGEFVMPVVSPAPDESDIPF